jgi:hypothetical protein
MRTTHRGLAIAVATTVAMLGSTLPAQAVTTYEIRVGSLEEGSTPEVPVLAGGDTIVDGDRRIPVDGYGYPMLLGPAGDSYVVAGVAILGDVARHEEGDAAHGERHGRHAQRVDGARLLPAGAAATTSPTSGSTFGGLAVTRLQK